MPNGHVLVGSTCRRSSHDFDTFFDFGWIDLAGAWSDEANMFDLISKGHHQRATTSYFLALNADIDVPLIWLDEGPSTDSPLRMLFKTDKCSFRMFEPLVGW